MIVEGRAEGVRWSFATRELRPEEDPYEEWAECH